MANIAPPTTLNTDPAEPTPLVKPSKIAAYYDVSRWTVDQWVKSGCPVAVRLPNGDRRFELAAVQQWLDAQAEKAEQAAATRSQVARTALAGV